MNVSFNTSNADKVKEKELNTRIIRVKYAYHNLGLRNFTVQV